MTQDFPRLGRYRNKPLFFRRADTQMALCLEHRRPLSRNIHRRHARRKRMSDVALELVAQIDTGSNSSRRGYES